QQDLLNKILRTTQRRQVGLRFEAHLDLAQEPVPEQLYGIANHFIQSTGSRLFVGSLRKAEHGFDYARALFNNRFDPIDPSSNLIRIFEILLDDLRRAFDDREDVVEIVSNACG